MTRSLKVSGNGYMWKLFTVLYAWAKLHEYTSWVVHVHVYCLKWDMLDHITIMKSKNDKTLVRNSHEKLLLKRIENETTATTLIKAPAHYKPVFAPLNDVTR